MEGMASGIMLLRHKNEEVVLEVTRWALVVVGSERGDLRLFFQQ